MYNVFNDLLQQLKTTGNYIYNLIKISLDGLILKLDNISKKYVDLEQIPPNKPKDIDIVLSIVKNMSVLSKLPRNISQKLYNIIENIKKGIKPTIYYDDFINDIEWNIYKDVKSNRSNVRDVNKLLKYIDQFMDQ